MALSKLERSNKAHNRLYKKHKSLFEEFYYRKPNKSFIHDIYSEYHKTVGRIQRKNKRLLSNNEKKRIYKFVEDKFYV